MAYTNSPLVSYTGLSPNHSGQRTHAIDRITPHCVVGQLFAETHLCLLSGRQGCKLQLRHWLGRSHFSLC